MKERMLRSWGYIRGIHYEKPGPNYTVHNGKRTVNVERDHLYDKEKQELANITDISKVLSPSWEREELAKHEKQRGERLTKTWRPETWASDPARDAQEVARLHALGDEQAKKARKRK